VAIGGLVYHRHKILAAVIDRALCTQLLAGPALILRTRGDKYPCAERAANLDCRGADARRTTVYQQYLARI